MPKWEYTFVRVEEARGMWRPRYVDGEELSDWKHLSSMQVFINEMGEQEWELTSFCPFWSTSYAPMKDVDLTIDYIQLIFKRPK
jgi:hypothetical protein